MARLAPAGGRHFRNGGTGHPAYCKGILEPLTPRLRMARHFPAINWLTSYSLYTDDMAGWFDAHVKRDWMEKRARMMLLLQEEAELEEVVQLVGMDALSAPDRLKLEGRPQHPRRLFASR